MMANGYFHYGMEAYQQSDTGPLQIIIGDGQQDKLITRITGQVAAALQENTDQLVHQFLFSLTPLGASNDGVQLFNPTPPLPPGVTAEVDGSTMLAFNGKICGQQISGTNLYAPGSPIICPFDYSYDPPIWAKTGTINVFLENRPFVNVEVHLTVQWRDP